MPAMFIYQCGATVASQGCLFRKNGAESALFPGVLTFWKPGKQTAVENHEAEQDQRHPQHSERR